MFQTAHHRRNWETSWVNELWEVPENRNPSLYASVHLALARPWTELTFKHFLDMYQQCYNIIIKGWRWQNKIPNNLYSNKTTSKNAMVKYGPLVLLKNKNMLLVSAVYLSKEKNGKPPRNFCLSLTLNSWIIHIFNRPEFLQKLSMQALLFDKSEFKTFLSRTNYGDSRQAPTLNRIALFLIKQEALAKTIISG